MNKIINVSIQLLVIVLAGVATLTSCEYKMIADAEYPEQIIYMPGAVRGIFRIDDVPQPTLAVPTPGEPYKFTVNLTARTFDIPLAVYRSGVNNKGAFTVDVTVNTDTISSLVGSGTLVNTDILTAGNYSIVPSVEMKDGEELAKFNLAIDLDYLLANYPDKIFALGVGISSTQRAVNPKYSTMIVVVHTEILKAIPDFAVSVDVTDPKILNFINSSQFGLGYSWDFGDGGSSTLKSPTHAYPSTSQRTVTLRVMGVDGNEAVISKDVNVPTPGDLSIEAENMTLATYYTQAAGAASGGMLARLNANQSGTLKTVFVGGAGNHDIRFHYFDENDGVSHFRVLVGTTIAAEWDGNVATTSSGRDANSLVVKEITGVAMSYADLITIEGTSDGADYAAVDKIEIIQH
jgi:PKD repeat protein